MFLRSAIVMALSISIGFSAAAFTLDRDIRKLSKMADVGTNGGSADIISYDANRFSYQKEIQDIMNEIRGSECKFKMIVGRDELVKSVTSTAIFRNSSDAAIKLRNMKDFNQLEAAVGYYWTGESGDSEYCSTEMLKIYFKNGKVLVIYFDSTT